jgi:hypothetical protein
MYKEPLVDTSPYDLVRPENRAQGMVTVRSDLPGFM